MTVRIIRGDCREVLETLTDNSVHCVVTSPPYYGLRDYGTAAYEGGDPDHQHDRIAARGGRGGSGSPGKQTPGSFPSDLPAPVCSCGAVRIDSQIGLEENPAAFLDEMVALFRHVRRVLRPDGTLWLNLGDSYAGSGKGGNPTEASSTLQGSQSSQVAGMVRRTRANTEIGGTARDTAVTNHAGRLRAFAKPKDLIGIPWRVAFALQADGWYLRQDIVWAKPNPMPESVTDRCTKSHEYLFLLTKSERYYYDADAIAEPVTASTIERISQPGLEDQAGSERVPGKTNGTMKAVVKRSGNIARKTSQERGCPVGGGKNQAGSVPWVGTTRNKRSVWTVATQGFAGEFCTGCGTFFQGPALLGLKVEKLEGNRRRRWCRCGRHDAWLSHFATFPPALIEPCILAGTSQAGVCPGCGATWTRVAEKTLVPTEKAAKTFVVDGRDESADANDQGANRPKDGHKPGWAYQVKTTGWAPSCGCPATDPVPATVLDPFGGAGTTALVADRAGRDALLIELNSVYAEMADQRITGDSPLFAQVTA